MRWQEILDRFRPVTAPGGAAESAEHVAERTGAALELAPVFAALDGALTAATDMTSTAHARAQERVDDARRRASGIVAKARMDAPAREAEAAAAVLARAKADDERVLSDAHARADALVAERSGRLDDAADTVIARLLDSLRAAP
jgi:vacuolar-type H+-ATPase subunit H